MRTTHHGVHEPHESPWVMTVPLIVLAVLSTVGGLIGVPYALGSLFSDHPVNYIEQTLEPVISHVPASVPHGETLTSPMKCSGFHRNHSHIDGAPAIHALEGSRQRTQPTHAPFAGGDSSGTFAGSGFGADCGFRHRTRLVIFKKRPLLQMPRMLENKYYVDEIYDAAIIKPIDVGFP